MKPPMPEILRKGAVIRVAGTGEDAESAAAAYAISFVGLLYADGHAERWLGAGAIRDDDLVPYIDLVAWGISVAHEHSMIADLGMAFSRVNRQDLDDAPVEVFIEWNAKPPQLT